MANSNSNKKLVPEAMNALDKFKYEVASDMCVKNIFTLISSSYFIFFIYAIFFFNSFISFNSLNLK